MNLEEFSNEFDILLNSYAESSLFGESDSRRTIELDEYEKSIFLTKAQEAIIIETYNGKNPYRESFEKTEEIRRYLNSLITTHTTTDKQTGYTGLSTDSIFFKIPDDVWFITYESATIDDSTSTCLDGKELNIVPTTQDEYYNISNNPFRRPSSRRAMRLDITSNIVEIISEYNLSKYLLRYISKPSPIILIDLPEDLSINDISIRSECKLNSVIHRIILERAVQLAINSKLSGQTNN